MGTVVEDVLTGVPVWAAYAAVFLLPFLEASLFVGFVFPGETAVVLGGVLASQGKLALPLVIAFALAGLFISVFYVAPPIRLKHHGLGEPGVFLVWGPLMVVGTFFVDRLNVFDLHMRFQRFLPLVYPASLGSGFHLSRIQGAKVYGHTM